MLFVTHLIDKGMQSSTVRSYVSAIKKILIEDGYQWNNTKILLSSLTRACRLVNDHVKTRLGINVGLLEVLLFEIQRFFRKNNKNQPYLVLLYQTIFALGYYGLMRVGKLTFSKHIKKATYVHLATNKQQILIVLYSSKTHSKANRPQKIKITADVRNIEQRQKRNFCPFTLMSRYMVEEVILKMTMNLFSFSEIVVWFGRGM